MGDYRVRMTIWTNHLEGRHREATFRLRGKIDWSELRESAWTAYNLHPESPGAALGSLQVEEVVIQVYEYYGQYVRTIVYEDPDWALPAPYEGFDTYDWYFSYCIPDWSVPDSSA